MTGTSNFVIGLDSSTTGCKAIAWDANGNAVAEGRASIPMHKPRPGWHEQNAEDWWRAARDSLRHVTAQIDTARLAGLSITMQRETFVVTDADGTPRFPAMVWMDERAGDLLPELDKNYGKERIHRESGKPLSANLSLSKLFWLQKHHPEVFALGARVMDVHAFLAHRLTGRFATAMGCADPTGLFDMPAGQWNAPLIEAIGLGASMFPEALPTGAQIGSITAEAERDTGLPEGLPLFAGIGDGQAAALGVSATQPGDACLILGTAVVSAAISMKYHTSMAFRTTYGALPGSILLETVLLGGAYTISWFLENFANGATLAELEQSAAALPPGADGLILVPYWNTAMNPYWDASATGIVAGWRGIHNPAHLYRAILEGIAFEQRFHTEGVEEATGVLVERYLSVGGGARSPLWRQIIADITGRPVFSSDSPEASALGAGIIAAVGSGLHPNLSTAVQAMRRITGAPALPDPRRQEIYGRLYGEVYRNLYPALRSSLASLDKIARSSSV